MQVEVDVKCLQTNLGGHDPFSFGFHRNYYEDM